MYYIWSSTVLGSFFPFVDARSKAQFTKVQPPIIFLKRKVCEIKQGALKKNLLSLLIFCKKINFSFSVKNMYPTSDRNRLRLNLLSYNFSLKEKYEMENDISPTSTASTSASDAYLEENSELLYEMLERIFKMQESYPDNSPLKEEVKKFCNSAKRALAIRHEVFKIVKMENSYASIYDPKALNDLQSLEKIFESVARFKSADTDIEKSLLKIKKTQTVVDCECSVLNSFIECFASRWCEDVCRVRKLVFSTPANKFR